MNIGQQFILMVVFVLGWIVWKLFVWAKLGLRELKYQLKRLFQKK